MASPGSSIRGSPGWATARGDPTSPGLILEREIAELPTTLPTLELQVQALVRLVATIATALGQQRFVTLVNGLEQLDADGPAGEAAFTTTLAGLSGS